MNLTKVEDSWVTPAWASYRAGAMMMSDSDRLATPTVSPTDSPTILSEKDTKIKTYDP